jgi:hypothetical protein
MHARFGTAFFLSVAIILVVAGGVAAHITGKTILVETPTGVGECLSTNVTTGGETCGAAVYGPDGFSGSIFFEADEIGDSVTIVDYICVHTRGAGAFKSFPGSYSLVIDYDSGTTTTSYTVTGGQDCKNSNNAVSNGYTSGATFIVPADGSVAYSVKIAGVDPGSDAQQTFASYNSIFNRVVGNGIGQANSMSVVGPTTFIIPEAPLSVLLLLSGGVTAIAAIGWRMRRPTQRRTVGPA